MSNSFYINAKQTVDGLSHNRGHSREGSTALTTSPTTAGVDRQKMFTACICFPVHSVDVCVCLCGHERLCRHRGMPMCDAVCVCEHFWRCSQALRRCLDLHKSPTALSQLRQGPLGLALALDFPFPSPLSFSAPC